MAVAPQETLLTNFEVYSNEVGSKRMMGIATVDLPEWSAKTEDLSGAGIMGEVSWTVPGHFESAEMTLHFRTPTADFISFMGEDAHDLTLRAETLRYDSALGKNIHVPIKINVRGTLKKSSPGKLEPATGTETELTLEILYYKMSIDSSDVLEIDKFNYIYKVHGSDQMIQTRTNLGL